MIKGAEQILGKLGLAQMTNGQKVSEQQQAEILRIIMENANFSDKQIEGTPANKDKQAYSGGIGPFQNKSASAMQQEAQNMYYKNTKNTSSAQIQTLDLNN